MIIIILILILGISITGIIFNKFIVKRILINKKFWKKFLSILYHVLIISIIAVPVALLIYFIFDSVIVALIVLIFLIFL